MIHPKRILRPLTATLASGVIATAFLFLSVPRATAADGDDFAAVDAHVRSAMEAASVPGLAYAVVEGWRDRPPGGVRHGWPRRPRDDGADAGRHRLGREVDHRPRDPPARGGWPDRRQRPGDAVPAVVRARGPDRRDGAGDHPVAPRPYERALDGRRPGSAVVRARTNPRGRGSRARRHPRRSPEWDLRVFERQLRDPRRGGRGGLRPAVRGLRSDARLRAARHDPQLHQPGRRGRVRPGPGSPVSLRRSRGIR